MIKKELRQELRKRLNAITAEQMTERGAAACHLLCQQPEYLQAEVVMIYLSGAREIDTSAIAQHAWMNMKSVLAPRVSWEQRRMLPIEITSLTSDVRPEPLGVSQPLEGLPVPVSDIDLVIVPGLGFDGHGNRLGRGRGFYDRFLSHPDLKAVSCALGLEDQVVESIPHREHDVRVKMLVTDARVRRFS